MRHIILTALVFLSALAHGGCASSLAPKEPGVFGNRAQNAYSDTDFDTDRGQYRAAIVDRDFARATSIRNNMLWSIINDVDYSYHRFKSDFYRDRATFHTVSDMAQLGLSSAATALGGSTILSAALTALKGSELSIDQNFFRERTTEALFLKMDALREEVMATIEEKLLVQAPDYGLEEAYRDTLRLFAAGTVSAALQDIAAAAGAQQRDASTRIRVAQENRIVMTLAETTREAVARVATIREAIDGLDPERQEDIEKINAALIALEITPPTDPDAAKTRLKDEWFESRRRLVRRQEVEEALRTAGIINQEVQP